MRTDENGLEILGRDECVALLRTVPVGRVVTTMRALPVALPVNFGVVDGGIVFRSARGTKLHAAADHTVMGFEADAFDADTRSGWSVLVVGMAEHVTDADEVAALGEVAPAPWGSGDSPDIVRIPLTQVTGRRIVPRDPDQPTAGQRAATNSST